MTERERQRALEQAQRARLRAQVALLRDTQAEIERLMKTAVERVRTVLGAQPSDYQKWQLPQLEREIQRSLDVFRAQASTVATAASSKSWDAGKDLVDGPLHAAGFQIAGLAPLLTQDQLQALKSFLTDRIRDVTADAINRVNTQLGLVTIGAQTPFDATKAVAGILEDTSLKRATTIVRTELGRAFSVANQARMNQAAKVVLMDKVWRRSGKLHQRWGHAIADGQRVAHDEPFQIVARSGEVIDLMFPRDPKGPPGRNHQLRVRGDPARARLGLHHARQGSLHRSRARGESRAQGDRREAQGQITARRSIYRIAVIAVRRRRASWQFLARMNF
jgi:hypothetical protein